MYDLTNFTKEEKDACLPTIDYLVYCTNIARTEGVLALEDVVQNHENYFLKFLIQLVVDGTDPANVESMANTLLNSEKHTGRALLERILITKGIFSIQTGEILRVAEAKLLCCLGEDYLKERGHGKPNYKPQILQNNKTLV
jgi:flagellar motor component MotA